MLNYIDLFVGADGLFEDFVKDNHFNIDSYAQI